MGLIIGGVSPHDLILDGKSVSLYVGGSPPVKVWPTRETVQITLGPGYEAQSQLRAALADYGLDYQTVEEIPFEIELVGTGSASDMFAGCSSLTTVPEMDTSQVTTMDGMFWECSLLTHIPPMDTSQVTDMSYMFEYCYSLTHVPDMDTSQVTNMIYMFDGCSSLTHVPDMHTSSVTDMYAIFSDCTSLISVPTMDTSQVTNMVGMFDACSSLTHAPAMDTSRVTEMNHMFLDCSALAYVPAMDTSKVTGMVSMFQNCSSLTDGNVLLMGRHPQVDITNMILDSGLTREPFDTVQITLGSGDEARDQLRAALTDRGLDYSTVEEIPFEIELVGSGSAQNLFYGYSELTTIPKLDTSNVTNMIGMFMDCSSLTHVPDMDTSSVANMGAMFMRCSSLTSVPEMDTSKVTNMGSMFYNCSSITSVPAMDTSKVTYMGFMFQDCKSLTTVPAMVTWEVTDMSYMFYNCTSLTKVPRMGTSKVTDMSYMFYNCSSLTDGNAILYGRRPDVNTGSDMITNSGLTYLPFYVEQVSIPKATDNSTTARDAFRAVLASRGLNHRTITYLPFQIVLTGNGNSVFDLFAYCSELKSVPSIQLPGVTSTRGMFNHCTALTSVGDLQTSNVSNTMYMFWNCSSLTDGKVRLIGKHPSVVTDVMISGSGLTRLPFYNTSGNPI